MNYQTSNEESKNVATIKIQDNLNLTVSSNKNRDKVNLLTLYIINFCTI